MLFAALMLVVGAWHTQQLAVLPSWYALAGLISSALLLSTLYLHPRTESYLQRHVMLRFAVIGFAAYLFGFSWAASLAWLRMSEALPHAWEQKNLEVIGVVASVPEQTERGVRFRFDVEQVLTPSAVVPHHISLSQYQYIDADTVEDLTDQSPQFHAGERWQLTVRLKRPHGTANPGSFDFEAWALAENIRATGSIKQKANLTRLSNMVYRPTYLVERLREHVRSTIGHALPSHAYRGVIQALVMGDDSQIGQQDWQMFQRTGTVHLMSISGLHITMLSGLVFGLTALIWRRIPPLVLRIPTRKAATLAGVVVAIMYALVAGFSIPTQRTLYMLLVFAAALWSGRQIAIPHVLALALVVVVLLDPWAVISPGFWLSFGAVAILAYALGARLRQPHWLLTAIKTQWAVTLGMLPILLVMFNQISIISPLANALAIPLISFLVTPLALMGSFLHVDTFIQWSHVLLAFGMQALHWVNALPEATWQQHAPPVWTLLPAMAGVLWLLLPRGWPMRWLGWFGLLPMFLIMPQRPLPGEMKISVLDVGQGLSVVVQTAQHALVYDTGPQYSEQSDAGSRIVLPYLRAQGIAKLSGLVVSHDDIDHSGGMQSILTQVPVSWLLTSFTPEIAVDMRPAMALCETGQRWVWDQVEFEVLYPGRAQLEDAALKDNDRSCVLKITSPNGSVLLAGDIERAAEASLLAYLESDALKSDVLVVPHHGSKTSSTPDFVEAVSPAVSVFTVGYLNRFRHPKSAVVERYEDIGSKIYRSDQHGAIELDFHAVSPQQNALIALSVSGWRDRYKRYWQGG